MRVAGGMGKLLNCFVNEQSPQEIMSYADRDWSEGDVYKKLGFRFAGYTPPIDFVINPETFVRISIKKVPCTAQYGACSSRSAPTRAGAFWSCSLPGMDTR